MSPTVWRLGEVLKEATAFLESRRIESPRLNAERLLARMLAVTRIDLYLRFEQPLTPEEREHYKALLRRRADHEPLQYILGETEFMSLPFLVTPDVLIPRPETEILVEKAVEKFQAFPSPAILDVGTGSGCIAVSLARYLKGARITAADVCTKALAVAAANAEKNGLAERIRFRLLDVRDPEAGADLGGAFDAVVANPPYVAAAEWGGLPEEIRFYEPREALCDEGDGYTFYRYIASRAFRWLRPDGLILLETGDGQAGKVRDIFSERGYFSEGVYSDLNGTSRVVCLGVPQRNQE
ncbi:MAG TPA: peptide chain release factor N(5)-glutamine methyltransferase [bacterium]|nr:peptide chain release factor N(5)-glutamine methyltransferase [bacterium]